MKVGDKVKIVKSVFTGAKLAPGQTGKVVGITEDDLIQVIMDNGHTLEQLDASHNYWSFLESELEVIE